MELERGLLNIKGRFGKDERRKIISTVCQVNRTMYDTFTTTSKGVHIKIWPSFDTGKDQIDPLRDIRVTEVLRKLDVKHCFVRPWSFGQDGEKDHKLKWPEGIATNADGQVITGELKDGTVKVFDIGGSFHLSFNPKPDDPDLKFLIYDVATDMNQNIYVLDRPRKLVAEKIYGKVSSAENGWEVHVYKKTADLLHKFPLIRSGLCLKLAVSNCKVFVLNQTKHLKYAIGVYDYADGRYVRSIEED